MAFYKKAVVLIHPNKMEGWNVSIITF